MISLGTFILVGSAVLFGLSFLGKPHKLDVDVRLYCIAAFAIGGIMVALTTGIKEVKATAAAAAPTHEELGVDEAQQRAYESGYRAGYKQGMADAKLAE